MAVLKDLIVHGPSRFLNKSYFNTINAESIGADAGIFNKLVATSLDAKTATIDDLTAKNATITALLDVQGELHTNSWSNANIATIDGSFYISPTSSSADGSDVDASGYTPTGTITYNNGNYTKLVVTGTFNTSQLNLGDATNVAWPANSYVVITGDVLVGNEWYPLGTIRGKLQSQLAADANSKTITVIPIGAVIIDGDIANTSLTDGHGLKPQTLEAIRIASSTAVNGSTVLKMRKIKVSMTSYGGTYQSPIGIFMTAMGSNKKTFLDIYGGSNNTTTIPSGSGALARPVLRIGNLSGLEAVGGVTPNGWGIYTSNGFFSGVIVSNSGKIGNFTINSALYSNNHSAWNTNSSGIYINNDGIAGGPGGKWWFWQDGSAKIGAMTLSAAGVLTVPAANVSGALTAATIDASKINAGNIAAARMQTNLITAMDAVISDLQAINATIGGFAIDSTSIHTNGVAVTSNADNSVALSSADFTRTILSTSRSGLRFAIGDKFGVTGDGVLYTNGANITNLSASNISTGTLSAERIAVTDFTNYCQLNPNTATLYGWTLTSDSSNPNTPWYVRDTLGRDNYPSTWFDCKPGDMFKVSMTVSSTVTGATTSGGDGGTYMNINLGVQCQTSTGSSNWPTFTIVTSNAAGTETTKTGYVIIPTSAEYIKFRAFIQIGGYAPFAGTLKIRNPVIKRVGADEYITYINSTDGIKIHNSSDTINYLQLNSTAIKMYRNNVQKMYLDDSKLQFTDGSSVLSQLDTTSQKFYDGDGNITAEFGGSGAIIGKTSNYHTAIDSNGMKMYDGSTTPSVQVASFTSSGSVIGPINATRLSLSSNTITFTNTAGSPWSIQQQGGTEELEEKLVTYQSASNVTATTYSKSNSSITGGNVIVKLVIGEEEYPLSTTYASYSITAGSSISVTITSSGVTYIKELLSNMEEDGQVSKTGELYVIFQVTQSAVATMNMSGKMLINGAGSLVTIYGQSNPGDTYFTAVNNSTGNIVRFGIGATGINRGIYDSKLGKWIIMSNSSGHVSINGSVLQVQSSIIKANKPLKNSNSNYIYGYHKFSGCRSGYFCFGDNEITTRIATKSASKDNKGISFMIANGYYSAGTEGTIETSVNSVYLCGGADATARFIRSQTTYDRTYSSAANVHITSEGTFGRSTSSSIRYKNSVNYITNINNATIPNIKKINQKYLEDLNAILKLPIVTFKYNEGYVSGEEDFNYDKPELGLIAEDVARICPEVATYIKDDNGKSIPESWDQKALLVRLLYIVQQQDLKIKELENRGDNYV